MGNSTQTKTEEQIFTAQPNKKTGFNEETKLEINLDVGLIPESNKEVKDSVTNLIENSLSKIEKACIEGMVQNKISINKMSRYLERPSLAVKQYVKQYKEILAQAKSPSIPLPVHPHEEEEKKPNKSHIINTTAGKHTENVAIMTEAGSAAGDKLLKQGTTMPTKISQNIFRPKG